MKNEEYEEINLRLDSLEDEVEVIHSRIDSLEELIKETRKMLIALSNSHAAIIKMNEILAKKLVEKNNRIDRPL